MNQFSYKTVQKLKCKSAFKLSSSTKPSQFNEQWSYTSQVSYFFLNKNTLQSNNIFNCLVFTQDQIFRIEVWILKKDNLNLRFGDKIRWDRENSRLSSNLSEVLKKLWKIISALEKTKNANIRWRCLTFTSFIETLWQCLNCNKFRGHILTAVTSISARIPTIIVLGSRIE